MSEGFIQRHWGKLTAGAIGLAGIVGIEAGMQHKPEKINKQKPASELIESRPGRPVYSRSLDSLYDDAKTQASIDKMKNEQKQIAEVFRSMTDGSPIDESEFSPAEKEFMARYDVNDALMRVIKKENFQDEYPIFIKRHEAFKRKFPHFRLVNSFDKGGRYCVYGVDKNGRVDEGQEVAYITFKDDGTYLLEKGIDDGEKTETVSEYELAWALQRFKNLDN